MSRDTVQRRRPRYILGTFWLLLSMGGIIGGFANGKLLAVLVGLLLLGYAVYLYRGGRFGLIVW